MALYLGGTTYFFVCISNLIGAISLKLHIPYFLHMLYKRKFLFDRSVINGTLHAEQTTFFSSISASIGGLFLTLPYLAFPRLRCPCCNFGCDPSRFNLLKTKRNLLYIRNQSVPRSKHFPPLL